MEENTYPQKLVAEMLGTAMLVFIGVGSVPATLIVNGKAPFTFADLGMISLAFATVVIAMIYAIGHISGCQINPAITLALAATKKMPWRDVPGYIAAQVVGAVLGALAIIGVLGHQAVTVGLGIANYGTQVGAGQAFFAEAVGTAILAFVVFGAIDRRSAGGFAGLAIGLAVFAVIMVVGPATSSAINPARVVGPMLVGQVFNGTVHWNQLPVYLIGDVVGAVAAGFLYVALNASRGIAATTDVTAEPVAAAEGALS
ncbi:aquaporin family protein [Streptomyces sp. IMTB 2501]|uniref:MIP/aquaporin family protein n=1 Tax=Streptomyces sp. IMTB 2501 TaxID=1776340 RepID=UPI00096D624C|nr:aquaporin [Streptomyces sp. IMTB 2501]OLZ62134.1 aquaporin family protein [Streptomyces sp. IMTB 2501]